MTIFSNTPDSILAEVAELFEPVQVPAGTALIRQGELGDCLYFIVSGRLRIHDGERTIGESGPAEVVGELALLDDHPRMASATALVDTQLLRLAREPFYQLMSQRIEIAFGIIRTLARRLRDVSVGSSKDFVFIQRVNRLSSAAVALQTGTYDSHSLDEMAHEVDSLGQLARIFQRMANEVQARERKLLLEVQELRFAIDEVKKARDVSEITESEYFKKLVERKGKSSKDRS